MQEAIDDNEYVLHLAVGTGTGQSMYQINQYNETHVKGTSNLIQAISLAVKGRRVKKIILSSSCSAYGEGKYECLNCGMIYPDARSKEELLEGDFSFFCPNCGEKKTLLPAAEDSAVKRTSQNEYTKYEQKMILKTMCPTIGIDYTIFRIQNEYGVGQSLKYLYTGILSVFSTLILGN